MSGFPPISLSGGDASSGSSTGDVYIPPELFQFPEYPAAVAANQSYSSTGNFQLNPVTLGLFFVGLVVLKKWGK